MNLINQKFIKIKRKKIPNPELDLKILLKQASYSKKEYF